MLSKPVVLSAITLEAINIEPQSKAVLARMPGVSTRELDRNLISLVSGKNRSHDNEEVVKKLIGIVRSKQLRPDQLRTTAEDILRGWNEFHSTCFSIKFAELREFYVLPMKAFLHNVAHQYPNSLGEDSWTSEVINYKPHLTEEQLGPFSPN